jgi:hypothetical protein
MKYIAYYRLSTVTRVKSGIGLEAKAQTVGEFIKSDKRRHLVAAYKEVDSGKEDELD